MAITEVFWMHFASAEWGKWPCGRLWDLVYGGAAGFLEWWFGRNLSRVFWDSDVCTFVVPASVDQLFLIYLSWLTVIKKQTAEEAAIRNVMEVYSDGGMDGIT